MAYPSVGWATKDLRPCWRCGGLAFWRSGDRGLHCAHCEPAKAHYLIAERLRAAPVPVAALERAAAFLRAEMKGRERCSAKTVIAAAGRLGIAPATLTRARWQLGLKTKRSGRVWCWCAEPDATAKSD
jgi:hypothetical protein